MNEHIINPAFKYKIIFKHDNIEEIFYALSKSDLEEIIHSLKSACSYGTYKNCKISHEKINS